MPTRTTPTLVLTVLPDADADTDLQPFIDTANVLVTDVVAAGSPGYSAGKLELIERWLSAHFYCVFDPRNTADGVGGLTNQYESRVDLGLNLTRYGQQALRIDTDGNLAALENEQKVRKNVRSETKWLGTPRCRP